MRYPLTICGHDLCFRRQPTIEAIPRLRLYKFRWGIPPRDDPSGFAGRFVIRHPLNPMIGKHRMAAVIGFSF